MFFESFLNDFNLKILIVSQTEKLPSFDPPYYGCVMMGIPLVYLYRYSRSCSSQSSPEEFKEMESIRYIKMILAVAG